MTLILALLDLYEQFLIVSALFTFIPVQDTNNKKQIIYFFSILIFLFIAVRISNSFQLFDGSNVLIIIVLLTLIMKFISNKSFGIIFLFVCSIFMFLGVNSSICYTITTYALGVTTQKVLQTQSLLLFVTILSKLIETFVFAFCRAKTKRVPLYFSRKWGSLLIVELIAFICLIIFLDYYFYGYDPLLNNIGIMITTCLFVAELYVFIILHEENHEKQNLQIALNKIEFDQKYYKDTLAQYNEMRKLKHDMKHIYHLITELASSGETEQIINLIGNSHLQIKDIPDPIVTGNSYLDYIINLKSSEARKNNIDISFIVEQIDLSFISDSDLFILIGNLLDNAIEHSSGSKKRISFSILARKNITFISCTNSVSLPNHKPTNSSITTTKKNKLFHGYGLQSIDMIAQKYDGVFSHTISDEKFTATVSFIGKICN